MEKNLKLTFILSMCLLGISLAFRSFCLFYGVGVAFVLMLGLFSVISYVFFKDKSIRKRVLDIYIITAAFLVLEFVLFFIGEVLVDVVLDKGVLVYQSVVTVLALFAFVYVVVRWVLERNGKKLDFGEAAFNTKKEKRVKPKTNKELSNGSLQDKPSKAYEQSLFENVKEEPVEAPVILTAEDYAPNDEANFLPKTDDEQSEN